MCEVEGLNDCKMNGYILYKHIVILLLCLSGSNFNDTYNYIFFSKTFLKKIIFFIFSKKYYFITFLNKKYFKN
jgi:hypothetical protein